MISSSSSHGFGFWDNWPRGDVGYKSVDLTAQSLQSQPLHSLQAKACCFHGKVRRALASAHCHPGARPCLQPGKWQSQPWGENTWAICKH